jgi:ribulose-phosphate 3-epimerase
MFKRIKISPSILSADFSRLGEEVRALCEAGADYIHVDVMDGHFVPNITIGSCVVEKIKKYSTVPLDVHLMITRPDKYAKDFINAGADLLTIHIEAEGFSPLVIENIRACGVRPGIAVSPGTSHEVLDDIIKHIDLILIMTVHPGFGNQKFLPGQLEKIRAVKAKAEQLGLFELLVAVDGGINRTTSASVVEAGANLLVAGTYIFEDKKYQKNIENLKATMLV